MNPSGNDGAFAFVPIETDPSNQLVRKRISYKFSLIMALKILLPSASQACVKNSVHGGGSGGGADTPLLPSAC